MFQQTLSIFISRQSCKKRIVDVTQTEIGPYYTYYYIANDLNFERLMMSPRSDGGGNRRARRVGAQACDGGEQQELRPGPVLLIVVVLLCAPELQLQQPKQEQREESRGATNCDR